MKKINVFIIIWAENTYQFNLDLLLEYSKVVDLYIFYMFMYKILIANFLCIFSKYFTQYLY